jgi:hypothetical protein
MRELRYTRWSIILAAMLGFMIGWAIPDDSIEAIDDWLRPVVVVQAKVVAREGDSVTVAFDWRKNRQCEYGGMYAYASRGPFMHETPLQRVDFPSVEQTHPAGWTGHTVWRIGPPLNGSKHVSLWIRYDCGGKKKFPQVAEIDLD